MVLQSNPTSIRLSPADQKDIEGLVEAGVYSFFSDAVRNVIREGVKAVKKERGLT